MGCVLKSPKGGEDDVLAGPPFLGAGQPRGAADTHGARVVRQQDGANGRH